MEHLSFKVEDLNVPAKLFSSVRYFIAGTIDQKIVKLLEAGGGTKRSSAILATTHVVAGPDADPLSLEEARDVFDLPVVRPSWVAYCAKLGKLVPVAGFSIDKDQLFGTVVASSFGLSQDEVKKLWATLMFYGGGFILDLGPSTTHLIANTSKMPLYGVAKQRNVKVVCIDWINDCIKANKLVDTAIYDPSLLKPPAPKIIPAPPRTTNAPVTSTSTKDVKLHIRSFGAHQNSPASSRLSANEKVSGSSPAPALVEQKQKPLSSPFNQEQLLQPKAQRMQPTTTASTVPKFSPVGPQAVDISGMTLQQQPPTSTSSANPPQLQYQLSLQQSKTSQSTKVVAQGTQFAAPASHAFSTVGQQSPVSKQPLQSPQASPIPQSPTRSPGSSGVQQHIGVQSPGASQHNQPSVNQSGSMSSPLEGHQTSNLNAQNVQQIFSQLQSNQQIHSNMQQGGQQNFMQSQNQSNVKIVGNQHVVSHSIPTSQTMLMQPHQAIGQQSQSVPQPQQSPQHGGASSPQGAQQKLIPQSLLSRSPLGMQGSQQMAGQAPQGQTHSPVQNSPSSIQNNPQIQQMGHHATDQLSQGNNQMVNQNSQQNFGQNNQGILSQLQSHEQKDSSNQQDLHHLLNQPISNNQQGSIQLITQSSLGRQQILLHKSGQQIQFQQSHQQGNQIIFQQASGPQQHQMLSQNTQNQNQQQTSAVNSLQGSQPGGQSPGPKLQQQLLGQQMQLLQQQAGQKQQSQQQSNSQQVHQQSSGQQPGMQSPSPQIQMLHPSSTQNTQYQQHSNQQPLQFNTQQVHLHLQSGQQMHNQQIHMQQQVHLIQKQQQGNVQQIHMSPVTNQSHQLSVNQQIQQQAGHSGHMQQTSPQQIQIQQSQLQMQTSSGHMQMQTQNVNQQIQLQQQQSSNQQSQMQQSGQLQMHNQGSGQLLHIQQQHVPTQQSQISQLQMHQQQGTQHHLQIQQSGPTHQIQLQQGGIQQIQMQQAQGGSQQMQQQGGPQQMQQQGGPQQMQIQQQSGPQQIQHHQQGPQQMQMQQQGGQPQLQMQQQGGQTQLQMQQQGGQTQLQMQQQGGQPQLQMQQGGPQLQMQQQAGPQQMQIHQQQVSTQQLQMQQQQGGPPKLQMQQKLGGSQQMQIQQQGSPQQMQMPQGGPQQMQQGGPQQMQQGGPQQMQQGGPQQMQQGGPQQMQQGGPQQIQQGGPQQMQQGGPQQMQQGVPQQMQQGGPQQMQQGGQQQMQLGGPPQQMQMQQGTPQQMQMQQGTPQQMQMQQGTPQQMQLQQVTPQQLQMQQGTPQQMQMQQGTPQQMQMQQQGGPQQLQIQQSGQQHLQQHGASAQQLQMQQQPGNQHIQVPGGAQQQLQMQQTQGGQMQLQPGIQQQIQQPQQIQMQLQQQQSIGTGQQIQMQQGVQQIQTQSQKNSGQQLQMSQGMQQIQMQSQGGSPGMHMQIQQQNSGQLQSQVGGTQVLQQTAGQQNSGPMSLQVQAVNQQLQPQQGNQMNQQVQNVHQPQYQFQLQQGGQQVVQLLQLPPQLQQSIARGQGGATLQMRQQGLISQQSLNIGQIQMSSGPQRNITATQQQLQQLRQSIPVGQTNTQQRPMQGHQQIIHAQLQQQINKVQISGGQQVVNVGSQQNIMQHTVMTMQQGQGQQGMQTQQLQQLLQQPQQQQQGIRQSPVPRQQVPMSMSPGGSQPQQSSGTGQQKVVFTPTNPRQITQEIFRQIQQDPQLKAQFATMDPQQRTLLIQQFAQRQRDRDQQMLLQQKMVNQQVQQQRFVTPGNVQGNAQRPQTQMIVTQQPGGVVQTQQIFTPPVGSPRLNVRHVVVHQQQRMTHPQQVPGNMQQQPQGHLQTQQIIVHQQQGALPQQQPPPQHSTSVNPIILQTGSPQQQQAQKSIQQQLPQGSPGMTQQQVIQIQVPSQPGHQQLARQPSQTNIGGPIQVGAQQSPPQNQPVGQRSQLSGTNSIIIQGQQILTPHSQQQLQQGSKIALIQSTQQWVSPGGTVVRSPSPASQIQSQVARPGLDSSPSPTGTSQQQWSLRQTSPVGNVTFPVSQANMPYVQVVNSKTKTALANLLSNRLQGNAGPESNAGSPAPTPTAVSSHSTQQQIVMCPPPPPAISQSPHASLSPQQTQVAPQQNVLVQRRTLTTMSTSPKASPGPLGRPPGSGPPAPPAGATLPVPTPRTLYYGHDPNIKLPSDGFLLGCVFWAPVPLAPKNWHLAVEQYGGEVENCNSPRITHVVCENTKFPEFQQVLKEGKRVVTLYWLNDVCVKKCVKPPYYATHLPVPFSPNERPLEGEQVGLTGFSGEDKQRVKIICKILGADVVRHLAMGIKMLITQKPEGTKFTKAREWKMPVVNIQFLNELLFGHLSSLKSIHSPKYQHFSAEPFRFDTTLVPHILAPWKVPLRVNQDNLEKYKTRKRLLEVKGSGTPDAKKPKLACDEYDCDNEPLTPPEIPVDENYPTDITMEIRNEGVSTGDTEVEKKPTINDKKPIAIMLSGFTREYKEKITKKIVSLGAKVTTDFRETTHLIMKESIRTNKLFVCLSRARYIVTLDWLHECLRKKKFVDAESFIMSNETIEKVYGVKLKDLLAKPDRHFLFANVTFYITPSCFPSVPDLKDIIEAAGGSIDTRQRSLQHARQQATKTPRRYVIITCVEDFKLVAEACKRHAIHLHTPEFIFESIAKQKFKPMKTITRLQPTVDKFHGSYKQPLQSKKT